MYIYRLTSVHRSSHDIVCQSYTVPCTSSARTVTVCRVITYAPGRALFPQFQSSVPKLCSKAPFQSSVPKLRSKAPFQSSVPKLRPYPGRDSYPRSTTMPTQPSKISARQVHSNPQADILLSVSLSLMSRYTILLHVLSFQASCSLDYPSTIAPTTSVSQSRLLQYHSISLNRPSTTVSTTASTTVSTVLALQPRPQS